MNRRDFLGTMTAAALASRFSWAADDHRIKKIGLELYTVRGALAQDFDGTLARVAKIGYKEVEFAGMFANPPAATPAPEHALEILKANGLTAPSTHVPYTALSPENWPKIIEACKIVGNEYIVNPSIDQKLTKTADGWKQAADIFNRAGEESLKSGIQFAYHNHIPEFKAVDGQLPYDILLSECDPKFVKMEMDLGWAHVAGADPLAYFAKYPGRFPLVHVKDFDKDGKMTEVGSGVIDWKAIFAKSDLAGIKHYFVEQDVSKSPFDSIQISYAYVEKLRF